MCQKPPTAKLSLGEVPAPGPPRVLAGVPHGGGSPAGTVLLRLREVWGLVLPTG